jgi:hypothetical protein
MPKNKPPNPSAVGLPSGTGSLCICGATGNSPCRDRGQSKLGGLPASAPAIQAQHPCSRFGS